MPATGTKYKDLLDYTVTYKAVWTFLGLIIIALVVTWFVWERIKPPGEDEKARQDLKAAERLYTRAQGCVTPGTPADMQAHLQRAQGALEQARGDLQAAHFLEASTQARLSSDLLKQFIDEVCVANDAVAEFVKLDGDVKVKKAQSPRWVPARKETRLNTGDRIKTGDGQATYQFVGSGETNEVRPGTIVEIHEVSKLPNGTARAEIKLEGGALQFRSVEGTGSTVETPLGTVTPRGGDMPEIENTEGQDIVRSVRGGTEYRHSGTGETATLQQNTHVVATPEDVGSVSADILGPELIEPIDGRVFTYPKPEEEITAFDWRPMAGARRYLFQLGRNEIFRPVLNPSQGVGVTGVEVPGIPPGQYYWRVAGVHDTGIAGRWSEIRRFSVAGTTQAGGEARKPPKLELTSRVPVGDKVIVSGVTDPLVKLEVYVNGRKYQDVDVGSDGGFQHIVPLEQVGRNVIKFVAYDNYGTANSVEFTRVFTSY